MGKRRYSEISSTLVDRQGGTTAPFFADGKRYGEFKERNSKSAEYRDDALSCLLRRSKTHRESFLPHIATKAVFKGEAP